MPWVSPIEDEALLSAAPRVYASDADEPEVQTEEARAGAAMAAEPAMARQVTASAARMRRAVRRTISGAPVASGKREPPQWVRPPRAGPNPHGAGPNLAAPG